MEKQVYFFSKQGADGDSAMKELLGGKGANLAGMVKIGLPVPAGFTLPTNMCMTYLSMEAGGFSQQSWLAGVRGKLVDCYACLKDLNDFDYDPLVSVRSGARVSMAGMMDTILNVGLTTSNLHVWKTRLGDRAALDSYRRLIQMFGGVVDGIEKDLFEDALHSVKKVAGVTHDHELSVEDLEVVISMFKNIYLTRAGKQFPDSLEEQLVLATEAVWESWNNERAIAYRKIHGIPNDWGTAVTVQSMVFGNLNDKSATGVYFTRCPSTGKQEMMGEYLVNAQGEDVVAGIRTPDPIWGEEANCMQWWNAEIQDRLADIGLTLESHYKDMQDIEFTVQDGEVFILQTRTGKRSNKAAFKVAHDLYEAGVLSVEDSLALLNVKIYEQATECQVCPTEASEATLVGIAAGGGVVNGIVALSSERAVELGKKGHKVILVAKETTPEDIKGMDASVGILTKTGGQTSHAAVVARGMNKVCVVGCTDLDLSSLVEESPIAICGSTGKVWNKHITLLTPEPNPDVESLLEAFCEKHSIKVTGRIEDDVAYFGMETESYIGFNFVGTKMVIFHLVGDVPTPTLTDNSLLASMAGGTGGKFLLAKHWIKKIAPRLKILSSVAEVKMLMLPDWMSDCLSEADIVDLLSVDTGGWKLSSKPSTIQDVIELPFCVIGNDTCKKLFGSKKVMNKILSLLKKDGIEIKSAPNVKSLDQVLVEAMVG